MNRDQLKRLIHFSKEIKAYINGDKLEFARDCVSPSEQIWKDVENPDFFDFELTFRIKGKPLLIDSGRFTDKQCDEIFKNMVQTMKSIK